MKNANRISGLSVLVLSYFAAAGAHAAIKTTDAGLACVVAMTVLAFGAGVAWGRRSA